MGLAISENRITSRNTIHTATRYGDHWEVSWLPKEQLTREQAISAMYLAWQITQDASMCGSGWPLISAWAGELGLTGQEAVALCQIDHCD